MRLLEDCTLFFILFISQCYAISCRTEHNTKEDELKKVFNNCLKQIEGNSSENRRNSGEDWGDRGYNQRNNWQRDNKNENRENRKNRNSRMGDRDSDSDSREDNGRGNQQNRDGMRENASNRMDNNNRQNTMGARTNRMGNMNGVEINNRGSKDNNMNGYGRNDQLSGQDEFLQSEEYGSDISHHAYYPSSQRRFKREKHLEMNSGQRSQYNPHSQRSGGREDKYNIERNSSDNSSKDTDRACVLHCFLENLHMTGDSGKPDRYLVTHALIKDQKNEDLRDFIQESIEECFQILDNENTEDKCEFSKNLLTCLSEKGRANCDDWNEKTSFLFEKD